MNVTAQVVCLTSRDWSWWAGPPIPQATEENNMQGAWGREWSSWSKSRSLGSIVLAFTLAKETRFCFKKLKIGLIAFGGLVTDIVCKQSPYPSSAEPSAGDLTHLG